MAKKTDSKKSKKSAKRYHSADTGKLVSEGFAGQNPKTTYAVPRKKKKK